MISHDGKKRKQEMANELSSLHTCGETDANIDITIGGNTAADRHFSFRVWSRQKSSFVDVTQTICPIAMKATEVIAIFNGDTGNFEKVIVVDQDYQFHLAETEVGLHGQYLDHNGAAFPDVWCVLAKAPSKVTWK